ncbi:asialoglycoprotein receptor 1-like [Micropterus salmoides]|uniref:asialoglycoprotein receptor 1-like n=1 Tax=Micropterus salmoides TaxID=27706 RepID=UPI0018EA3E2B|nr:asialoglycoprotein receptor 1-like [Micropterus salmoides]
MNRKPLKATGTLNNSSVYVSAEVIEEEADYVNAAEGAVDRMAVTSDQKFLSFTPTESDRIRQNHPAHCHWWKPVAVCWVILLGIMALRIYFATLILESEPNQLKENQMILLALNGNLTNQNNKLSSENENLRREHNNLTVQLENLTQAYTVLKSNITNLSAENQNLTSQNQELKTERIELNVSRAQWSIDAYCPKPKNQNRTCKACQDGWFPSQSSCYGINNPDVSGQKTWEEARENCRGKISDLVVIADQTEKTFIETKSWSPGGYWIGLRAEDGKWKWFDGSVLTENSWIQQPATNGQCVISVEREGWKSVSCGDRNRWFCKKKALSL